MGGADAILHHSALTPMKKKIKHRGGGRNKESTGNAHGPKNRANKKKTEGKILHEKTSRKETIPLYKQKNGSSITHHQYDKQEINTHLMLRKHLPRAHRLKFPKLCFSDSESFFQNDIL